MVAHPARRLHGDAHGKQERREPRHLREREKLASDADRDEAESGHVQRHESRTDHREGREHERREREQEDVRKGRHPDERARGEDDVPEQVALDEHQRDLDEAREQRDRDAEHEHLAGAAQP